MNGFWWDFTYVMFSVYCAYMAVVFFFNMKYYVEIFVFCEELAALLKVVWWGSLMSLMLLVPNIITGKLWTITWVMLSVIPIAMWLSKQDKFYKLESINAPKSG